jgi:hypothetical protein
VPNYLGYVSWFWGDKTSWTINCDKPFYFPPNTCLVVHVPSSVTQLDGPPLAKGVFVAIYADPATASSGGITVSSFRTSATPFAGSPLPNGYVAPTPTPTPTPTQAPNYLGYVSWFWGDQTSWTINCDKATYFAPKTCLPVKVPAGVKQLDGPPLAVGVFVAIFGTSATTNGSTGLTVQWFRTSKTPFAGSPLPNGYASPSPSPTASQTPTPKPSISPSPPPTPTPTPTPTPPPTGGNTLPGVWSQIYSNTPFHRTVAQLKAVGAATLPQSAMNSLWSEGVSQQDLSSTSYYTPVYVSSASDPLMTFTCTGYGACNANGSRVHVPKGAQIEPHSDGHIAIIDTANSISYDGWACSFGTGSLNCVWGGLWHFGGNGLTTTGSEANHAGYAAGLFIISPQELANGHIDHALGMNTWCLNNPTVYPSDLAASGTDQGCGGSGAPAYGDLVHLLWTPAQIASSAYSTECKTILTALATYGAYTKDTGSDGLSLSIQGARAYTSLGLPDPLDTTILPHLRAAGDATGQWWSSCLNRLKAADLELLQIPSGS